MHVSRLTRVDRDEWKDKFFLKKKRNVKVLIEIIKNSRLDFLSTESGDGSELRNLH
jgi:hypothetical protein